MKSITFDWKCCVTDCPKSNVDVLLKMVDGSLSVGYLDQYNDWQPDSNVDSGYDMSECCFLIKPVYWTALS